MILLKKIRLVNFLSHSDTILEFKDIQKLIITGKSGSGKSSIIEAILWSIYNEGRGSNKLLIKNGKEQASVTLDLYNDKTKVYYQITRKIDSKNKHEVLVLEGKNKKELIPIKATGVREVQDYVDREIIKSSYLLFINSVLYPQNSSESFILQSANKRKDIILEIAKTEDYDLYYKKAKELLSLDTVESHEIKSVIKEKEYQIKMNELNSLKISDYEIEENKLVQEIELLEKERGLIIDEKDAINKKITLISNNIERLDEINRSISINEDRILELRNKITELDKIDKNFLNEKVELLKNKEKELELLEEKQKNYFSWKDEMNKLIQSKPLERDYDKEIADINRQLIDLMTVKIDSCPQCGFISPELKKNHESRLKYLEDEITVREQKKAELEKMNKEFYTKVSMLGTRESINQEIINGIEKEIEELQVFEKQLLEVNSLDIIKTDIGKEIENINSEQHHLRNKKLDLEIELKDRGLYNDMFKEISNKLLDIEKRHKELYDKKMDNHGNLMIAREALNSIGRNRNELVDMEKRYEKLLNDIDSITLVKEAFSSNGIKSIVIDMLIPKLEDTINSILEKLSDFTIKFETQKSGSGKDTVLEGLFIEVVSPDGNILSVENLSGGESVKVGAAIFESFASISNCGFRILDESILGLDDESIAGFSNVILQLQKTVSQLICISHIDLIQNLFEEKIEVVKINSDSKIA